MKMGIKHLDLLCLIMVVAATVACGYLAVYSGIKKQQMIHEENERIEARLKDLNRAEDSLQRLNGILDATKKELASLNRRIPDSAAVGLFLKDLDALMQGRQITLVRVQPLPEVEEKLFTRIPIRFNFKGLFVRIYEFLQDLENLERTVVMEKMAVYKSKTGEECNVDLTASIFER